MTLLIFLVILSVLVLVHELGHFVMAKRAGILVEEFGFGLPPRIWGKKIGETIYSINWLPIGGFVKLHGEDQPELTNPERAFFGQKKRVRLAILIAGVVMNFLLGVVIFSAIYSRLGIPTRTDRVRIVGVETGSPAQGAGVKLDEVVVAVDKRVIRSTKEFIDIVRQSEGREIELTLGDGTEGKYGRIVTVAAEKGEVPAEKGCGTERVWQLGVVISDVEMYFFPPVTMPLRGAVAGVREAVAWGTTILSGLVRMGSCWVVAGEAPKDVAGPVGIFQLTGSVKQAGILALLQFMGVLSVNLAVLNLLPLPALDGGRLAFLGVEAVMRKKVRPGVEKMIHAAGMAFLLGLMVLVTVNDIVRLTNTGSFVGLLQKVWPW